MFIEQGIKKENDFWKYIVGSIAVIIASFIGQLPLVVVIFSQAISKGEMPTTQEDLMKYLNSNLSLFLMLLSFAFALGALYLVIKYFHKQTFLSVTTSRSNVDWSRIFFSFGIWTAFTVLSTVAMFYLEPKEMIWNFKPVPFLILFLISVVMIPIQTSTEEYIFRGYLMQGFGILAKNRWFPLLMTSVIFGGMHYFNPEVEKMGNLIMVYYIGTGLFLGIITLMDDGMELALGFHAANNLIGALLVTSDWTVLQTNSIFKDISDPSVGFDILLPVLVVFPIVLYIFGKKYHWNNWKEKLTGTITTNDSILQTNE
jgi:membrane protease YdiL (CAAX protease family)